MIQMDDHFRAVAGGAAPSGYEPTGRTAPDDGARWCSTCKLDVPIAAYCTNCGKDFEAFRGFTSGKTTHDPRPYRHVGGWRTMTLQEQLNAGNIRSHVYFDPRPEYDNHNPILVWLRAVWGDPQCGTHAEIVDDMLNDTRMIGSEFTSEQRAHARRVLTKLAALTTTTNGVTD